MESPEIANNFVEALACKRRVEDLMDQLRACESKLQEAERQLDDAFTSGQLPSSSHDSISEARSALARISVLRSEIKEAERKYHELRGEILYPKPRSSG